LILQDIINIIESVAPLSYQEAWDNSGLQVGDCNAEVHAALLTVDVTESVVNEAINKHCDLIISHHPLLFKGLKHLTGSTPQERCVELAIRHGIAIYSSHTSMDAYLHGVSGKIAEKLGITHYQVLCPSSTDENVGLGVIGNLPSAMDRSAFVNHVQDVFGCSLRYVEACTAQVQRIAICGGAGSEFLETAIQQGAHVYITADMKYHEMQAAYGRIGVIDLDHWTSEHFTREIFEDLLRQHIPTHMAETDLSPIVWKTK
jgi:dinuclear metal center YbgI/SA1388 family protein